MAMRRLQPGTMLPSTKHIKRLVLLVDTLTYTCRSHPQAGVAMHVELNPCGTHRPRKSTSARQRPPHIPTFAVDRRNYRPRRRVWPCTLVQPRAALPCAHQRSVLDTRPVGNTQAGVAMHVEFNPVRGMCVVLPPGATFVIAHSLAVSNKAETAPKRWGEGGQCATAGCLLVGIESRLGPTAEGDHLALVGGRRTVVVGSIRSAALCSTRGPLSLCPIGTLQPALDMHESTYVGLQLEYHLLIACKYVFLCATVRRTCPRYNLRVVECRLAAVLLAIALGMDREEALAKVGAQGVRHMHWEVQVAVHAHAATVHAYLAGHGPRGGAGQGGDMGALLPYMAVRHMHAGAGCRTRSREAPYIVHRYRSGQGPGGDVLPCRWTPAVDTCGSVPWAAQTAVHLPAANPPPPLTQALSSLGAKPSALLP